MVELRDPKKIIESTLRPLVGNDYEYGGWSDDDGRKILREKADTLLSINSPGSRNFLDLLHVINKIEGQCILEEYLLLYYFALMSPSDYPILEIGSLAGASTIVLAEAALQTNRDVISLDPYPISTRCYLDQFKNNTMEYSNIVQYHKGIKDAVGIIPKEYSFVFIDGDHNYDSVKSDFELSVPLIVENGFIAMHDYQWGDNLTIHSRLNNSSYIGLDYGYLAVRKKLIPVGQIV